LLVYPSLSWRRKAPTEPFGGYGYFAHGILHINEAVAQSVYDFRLFMDYLESTGVEKMGVTGYFFRRLYQCYFGGGRRPFTVCHA
jgi:hypothetical protein